MSALFVWVVTLYIVVSTIVACANRARFRAWDRRLDALRVDLDRMSVRHGEGRVELARLRLEFRSLENAAPQRRLTANVGGPL